MILRQSTLNLKRVTNLEIFSCRLRKLRKVISKPYILLYLHFEYTLKVTGLSKTGKEQATSLVRYVTTKVVDMWARCVRTLSREIGRPLLSGRRFKTEKPINWLSERLSKQLSRMGALDVIRSAAEKVPFLQILAFELDFMILSLFRSHSLGFLRVMIRPWRLWVSATRWEGI
jgi:hypothetical protein